MTSTLSPSAQKVQAALIARGFPLEVIELPESTRTAAEAAAAVGCTVGQIAKSIIFTGEESERPVLAVVSGANRVDVDAVSALAGDWVAMATPEFVRERTGYVIGGVPPVGHSEPPLIFIDADLLQYEEIWAAAGTPNAVFKLTPTQLVALTGGHVSDLKLQEEAPAA